jgi:hypothetical protein
LEAPKVEVEEAKWEAGEAEEAKWKAEEVEEAMQKPEKVMAERVKELTGKIEKSKVELEDCAYLAICIIASWIYRVRHLDLKWWEYPNTEDPQGQSVRQTDEHTAHKGQANSGNGSSPASQRTTAFQYLPAVSGLG